MVPEWKWKNKKRKPPRLPELYQFYARMTAVVNDIPTAAITRRLDELVDAEKFADDRVVQKQIGLNTRADLIKALKGAIGRLAKYLDILEKADKAAKTAAEKSRYKTVQQPELKQIN